VHKKFGTATVVLPDKFKIDIATARSESYRHPAALPEVKFTYIRDDLYRRDFTINAMAIRLNRKGLGALLDFFGGERDLRMRKIRVLHDESFVDDPTRIFRAVRFEQRYNFVIEKHTEGLIKKAVSLEMFDKTQKQRLRDELILILKEDEPLRAVLRMKDLHELHFIHPKIVLNTKVKKSFTSVARTVKCFKKEFPDKRAIDVWLVYFCLLIQCLSYKETQDLCSKFVFTKTDTLRILATKKLSSKILKKLESRRLNPSQIYRLLQPLSYETILFIMSQAKTAKIKKRISSFLKDYGGVKVAIGGSELKNLGLLPGPEFKHILNEILYAKIDGKLKSRAEELEFARKLIQKKK
jgi:tRNA nucleotidyltransferase (CCA-adding enzyme)